MVKSIKSGLPILILFLFIKSVYAAEVIIDDSVNILNDSFNGSSPTVVFISNQVGYGFYRDANGSCVYSKTTNAGATWGAAVTVDPQIDCLKIAVWYDRWTPGDAAGTLIHISTIDSGNDDIWYSRLDTSNDVLTSPINTTLVQTATLTGASIHSITKGTDGDLYMGVQSSGGSFVVKCLAGFNCTQEVNWTSTGTSPFDLADDYLILMPLPAGNIMAIRWDISANDIQSKVFTDGLNVWDINWTTVDAVAVQNAIYDGAFGATLNKSSGDIYLAYGADIGVLGTDDDIRTAVYSGGTWTAKTNILTNDARGITGVKVAVDENTGDIYAIYTARTIAGTAGTANVYFKKSATAMTSWDNERGPLNNASGDLFGARVNILSNTHIFAKWKIAGVHDLAGATVADFAITQITLGTTGNQVAGPLEIPSSDQYIGGAFTLTRTNGASLVNITAITITATGTVNAGAALSNTRLYFETAATCVFDRNESLFGIASGFNISGKALINGAVTHNGEHMCLYVTLNIGTAAASGQTVEIEISNPSTEVIISTGTVAPSSAVAIAGTTSLTSNKPPATPTNISPANGAIVNNTLTPSLSASAFSDPDGDTFSASHWQVTTTAGNFTSPVWDSGVSGPATTTVTVGTTLSNNTTYFWHVRYKDSFGLFSPFSSETSFTVSNAAPTQPINTAPAHGAVITTLTPLLEASAFSDAEGNSHVATRWRITTTAGNYTAPITFDFTSLTGETSRQIPPGVLNTSTTYFWKVRYRDDFVPGHFSLDSKETSFTTFSTAVTTLIAIKIQPLAGKTDFFGGETIPLDAQVVNATNGSPVNDATATISIFNPTSTKIVDSQPMILVSGSNGVYRFNFVAPSTNGVYAYEVRAEKGGEVDLSAANLQVGAAANIASDIAVIKSTSQQFRTSQQRAFTITLSDVDEIQLGKDLRLKLFIQDFESKFTDTFSLPTVIIFDAVRNIVASGSPMTKLSTGTYELVYTTSVGQTQGLWEAVATIPLEASNTSTRSDFFQLVGSPAQVKINAISDNTIPTISANVTISNEGVAPFEYHYEYCVVIQQINQCGGGDDVDYAIAAKFINPGQSFTSDLVLTVPQPGDYYFKTIVYWGTERSGAARQFNAVPAPAQEPALAPYVPSAGGGIAYSIPAPPAQVPGFIDSLWQKIVDLFSRIFVIDKKMSALEKRTASLENALKKISAPAPEARIPSAIRLPTKEVRKPKEIIRRPAKQLLPKIRLK